MKKSESKSSPRSNKTYSVIIKDRAIKELKKLPKVILSKVDEKIRALASNPRPDGCKKLEGYENFYRIRHSDYRVVYSVEDDKLIVEIIHIGNRKEIYRKLK